MLASVLICKAVLDLLHWEAVAFANMLEFYNIQVMYTETDRNRSGILQDTSD